MAGDGENYEVEGSGDLNAPITRFHFNALRDHLCREFRNSLDPIEEKQEKLSQDLRQLMGNVNEQLTQNMAAMRANLVDRKSTRLNSSHSGESRMPSSA